MFFFALAGCDMEGPKGAPPTLETGSAAPPFALQLIGGGEAALSGYKGKPLVITFMASWCPCSHESAPVFKAVYEEYREKGVQFLMIGMQDGRSKFEKFYKEKGFPYPAGFDEGDRIAALYGVSSPPTTFFIGRDGTVVSSFYGKIVEKERLTAWVEGIAGEAKEAQK